MSFFNLPWQWDDEETPAIVEVGVHYKRFRRGPVTFYRRVMLMPNGIDHDTLWEICVADDLSFGVHLPKWLSGHDNRSCPFCNGKYTRASPVVDALSDAIERCREVYDDTKMTEQGGNGAWRCLQIIVDLRANYLNGDKP